MSASESSKSFTLRRAWYDGHATYTVCHGHGSIPPPIIALCNFFLLKNATSGHFKPPGGQFGSKEAARTISKAELLDTYRYLVSQHIRSLKAKAGNQVFMAAINSGNHLLSDTKIQPCNTGRTADFSESEDSVLGVMCVVFEIPIHHGWLLDPTDESPDKADDSSESQLTDYGMASLSKAIEEGQLALLFRKNHVSLVLQRHGSLFTLETDDARYASHDDIMWKTLNMSDNHETFFKCDFHPLTVEKQPHHEIKDVQTCVEDWQLYWENLEHTQKKDLDILMGKEQKKLDCGNSSKSTKKKGKKSTHGNLDKKLVEGQKTSNEESMKDILSIAGSTEILQEDKWIAHAFMDFLEKFVDEDDIQPNEEDKVFFFVREVENMRQLPVKMQVMFPDIEKHNPKLAFAILNDRTRLNEVLTRTVVEFRERHYRGGKKQSKGKVRLVIREMPTAESIQPFSDFLDSNSMFEPHTFFTGETVNSTSYMGRRAGTGYVEHLLENHNEGLSWNGEWELSDMAVKNGKFVIMKAATVHATDESMSADFLKLIKLLEVHYKSTEKSGPGLPAYFDQFQKNIMEMPKRADKKFKTFQRYLAHHPVFKSPLTRSALFRELFRVCQSLRHKNEQGINEEGYLPLDNREGLAEWNTVASGVFPFSCVYDFNNWKIGSDDIYLYGTYWNLLQFLRHSEEHLTDHTQVNNVQQIRDIVQVDLMISDQFDEPAANLILKMMYELTDAVFLSTWEHYETSL